LIDSFTKQNFFLSNFFYASIYYEGHWYPTVEHAFQAQKNLVLKEHIPFYSQYELDIGGYELKEISANEAKIRGRKLKLREDWEKVKVPIMEDLVHFKFHFHSSLRKKLIATESAELVEGNWWNDTEWGVYKGVGKNYLGKILMNVRKLLN